MGGLFSTEKDPLPSKRSSTSSTAKTRSPPPVDFGSSKAPLPSQLQSLATSKTQQRPLSLTSSVKHTTSAEIPSASLKNEESIKTSLTQPKESLKPSVSTPPKHFSITPSPVDQAVVTESKPSPAIRYAKKPEVPLTGTSSPLAPVRPALRPTPLTESPPYSSLSDFEFPFKLPTVTQWSQSLSPTSTKADSIPISSSKPQERPQSLKSSINHSTSVETWISSLKNEESVEPSLTEPKQSRKSSLPTPSRIVPALKSTTPSPVDTSLETWYISSIKNETSIKSSLTTPKESLKPSLPTLTKNVPAPKCRTPSSVDQSVTGKPSGSKQNSKPSTAVEYVVKKPQVHLADTSPPVSSAPLRPDFKPSPLIVPQPSSSASLSNAPKKANYVWVQKDTTPLFAVPEDFKELIVKDIVPQVLRKSLTPMSYKNYFEALLYAEDVYCEKWSEYCLKNVTLELHEAAIYRRYDKKKKLVDDGRDDKVFVAFRIDSIPERRPFLLSRDFVLLRPLGKTVEPFQGILYRVVQSNLVLAEFEDDFYLQHSPMGKYNVSFSFNRVCLKRCHQAITVATDTLFHNFLFPGHEIRIGVSETPFFVPHNRYLNQKQLSAVDGILRLKSSPPFLVEGPLCIIYGARKLSATGLVIQEAVHQIYSSSPSCRILICAPTNNMCDLMMKGLQEVIPKPSILRANAAFRDLDEVPDDILPFCPVKGDIFTCPPLGELKEFKVVLSTFMSSFRLHSEGITAGHFTHVFLLDASSTMEPETVVPLANLVDEKTVVVVTGAIGDSSGWIRSVIAREWGLKRSYFQRLLESEPYCSLDPMFVARIRGSGAQLN